MDFHQSMLIHMYTALSYLFLYLGVLAFSVLGHLSVSTS